VIPRKVRDLFGLLSAKIARVEAQLSEERPEGRHDKGGKKVRRSDKKHKYAAPEAFDETAEDLREGQPPHGEMARLPGEKTRPSPFPGETARLPGEEPSVEEPETLDEERSDLGPEESDASSEGNAEAEEKPEEIEEVFSEVPLPDDLEAEVERLVEAAVANPFGIQPRGHAQTMDGRGPAQARAQAVPGNAVGASTTPTNPPLAEDPAVSADRRAEGVEAQLDAKFFGNE
jgi:hypothetical protein